MGKTKRLYLAVIRECVKSTLKRGKTYFLVIFVTFFAFTRMGFKKIVLFFSTAHFCYRFARAYRT